MWLWLELSNDGSVDYQGSDCGHGGAGTAHDGGETTWHDTNSGAQNKVGNVILDGLGGFPATVTTPSALGHYTGRLGSSRSRHREREHPHMPRIACVDDGGLDARAVVTGHGELPASVGAIRPDRLFGAPQVLRLVPPSAGISSGGSYAKLACLELRG